MPITIPEHVLAGYSEFGRQGQENGWQKNHAGRDSTHGRSAAEFADSFCRTSLIGIFLPAIFLPPIFLPARFPAFAFSKERFFCRLFPLSAFRFPLFLTLVYVGRVVWLRGGGRWCWLASRWRGLSASLRRPVPAGWRLDRWARLGARAARRVVQA